MNITVFGKGNMGKAIGANFEKAGNQVTYAGRDFKDVRLYWLFLMGPWMPSSVHMQRN